MRPTARSMERWGSTRAGARSPASSRNSPRPWASGPDAKRCGSLPHSRTHDRFKALGLFVGSCATDPARLALLAARLLASLEPFAAGLLALALQLQLPLGLLALAAQLALSRLLLEHLLAEDVA